MANFDNPMTDALKLVQYETVHRGWFTPAPAINAEEGFLLEHYRGNVHISSYSSSQLPLARRAPGARDGDIIFRLNLGSRSQLIEGSLRTWEGCYTRPYRFVVDLQIKKPEQLLSLYRQEADPVALVVRAITEAIQQYASRTIYEDIHPLNFVAKVQSIFDREPDGCKAGICIQEVHDPTLDPDPNYQPVMLRQLLPLKGNLTTRDGYERGYEVQIELEVIDLYTYKHHDRTGEKPLTLVQVTIHDELQRYAHEFYYEEFTDPKLQDHIENNVFAAFPKQTRAGLRIMRAHNFSLKADARYKPVPKIQTLTIAGTLKTLEGYERTYRVKVEFQMTNLHDYLQRWNENTAPLDLAQAAIEGEILQFAAGQNYEVLNDEMLRERVEHAFDRLTRRETGGLGINVVHLFTLQPAPDYVVTRVLDITGVIKTSDVRECPYTMTVEVKIGDAATFVQLTRDGTNPLNLAKEAIAGAIVNLARDKEHAEVLKLDLAQAARNVFKQAPNTMIAGLSIVEAHKALVDIDANLKASADIEHAKEVELTELLAKSSLMKRTQHEEYELRKTAEEQNLDLTIKKGQTADAQLISDVKREQILAMSRGHIEFLQKAFQIEIENLEAGASHAEVFQNIQNMIQSTQSNFPQIAGKQNANGQPQLQGDQEQVPALKASQPAEDKTRIIDEATGLRPTKKSWPEAGLTLMEVPLLPTLIPYLDERTHAFQVQKIEVESPARKAGVCKGDYLVGIEDQDIHTLSDFDKACASFADNSSVIVYVVRTGPLETYTLHLAEKEEE